VREEGAGKEELDRAFRRFLWTACAFFPTFASFVKHVASLLSPPYSLCQTVAIRGTVLFNSSFVSLPLANSARSHATSNFDLLAPCSAAVDPISACYKVSKQLQLWLDPKLCSSSHGTRLATSAMQLSERANAVDSSFVASSNVLSSVLELGHHFVSSLRTRNH